MLRFYQCQFGATASSAVLLVLLAASVPADAQTADHPSAMSAPSAKPLDTKPSAKPAATSPQPAKPGREAKHSQLTDTPVTSPNSTVNLVNILVKQGMLKEEQAEALIKQADQEAYVARQAAKAANVKAEEAAQAASAAAAAASPPDTKHVTYVPEIVKRQLREEIRNEVMIKARKENWASPGIYPEWAQRIHFYGDFRARYQGSFFPAGNDQYDAINFNAINQSSTAYDVPSSSYYPTFNTTQDRNQAKLRARLGMDADLTNGFAADLRIATGDNSSPVSTNQTLGLSTNGGNFSKSGLWLDRGSLQYQSWNNNFVVSVGRFDNPFWSPTDLIWYNDLGFDGAAVQAKYPVTENFEPFAVAGAFPIYNTDFNAGFNTASPYKLPSNDKWLFGGQLGFGERFGPRSGFKLAAAFYDFDNVQGKFSDPCIILVSSDTCDTDLTRPAFAQKGNTYMQLRDVLPVLNGSTGALIDTYQFYGLASAFRPVVVNAELDLGAFHPYHVILDGEYVVNTAFDRRLMMAQAVNNLAGTSNGSNGTYNGGNQGWLAKLTVGNPQIHRLWDWNVYAGYKYLQSDATVDAFTDPDFGLGGTNLKGYFIGANVGLSENVWATLKWMSANNISGIPYAADVLQIDLNARF